MKESLNKTWEEPLKKAWEKCKEISGGTIEEISEEAPEGIPIKEIPGESPGRITRNISREIAVGMLENSPKVILGESHEEILREASL